MLLSIKKANSEQRDLDDAFSTLIKARWGWICAICGSDYRIQCHHIIPREHKEFRYSENNAIPLCVAHHKFSRSISAHNNPLSFFLWLSKFHLPLYLIAVERTKKILEQKDGIQLN
jgi:hypothetical protein